MPSPAPPRLIDFFGAFATGGLLTLMVWFNGTLAGYGTVLFSSWVPHLTGTVVAIAVLFILRPTKASTKPAPGWAYLGGISGAVTVVLTSTAMQSPLAVSGTIALGLAGQMVFSLAADKWGLLGLPKRAPTWRDIIALLLIFAGSLILIFWGAN
ncbi:MAG: DMT family transporter [Pseudomonadota bacterium]